MKKKTTSLGMKLVAFLAMLMLFCIPVSAGVKETAGEYEIYPTPQEITYGDKEMQLTDQVKLSIGSDIDDYTKTRITDTLNVLKLTGNESAASDKTELVFMVPGMQQILTEKQTERFRRPLIITMLICCMSKTARS